LLKEIFWESFGNLGIESKSRSNFEIQGKKELPIFFDELEDGQYSLINNIYQEGQK